MFNMDISSDERDIILLDDDDDDVITSTGDISFTSKTQTKTISNVELIASAMGEANYNMIIDALCTVTNVDIKSRALAALFTRTKEYQNREVQTEAVEFSDTTDQEVPTVCNEISVEDALPLEETVENPPDYYSEVIIESQPHAESIITGEGELNLNQCSNLKGVMFLLKGDGSQRVAEKE